MADTPGNDTPSTDPKPTGKSGPVKPPVLEAVAKPVPGAKPGEAGDKEKLKDSVRQAAAASPAQPKPAPAKAEPAPGGAPWLAGLVGGVLGLGAAYGLAWFGLWPAPAQPAAPADPRIAQFAGALPELQSASGAVRDDLASLGNRLAQLETSIAELPATPASNGDAGLTEALAALSGRVDALAAAGEASTGGDNGAADAALEAELARLREEADAIVARLSAAETEIAGLVESGQASAGASDAAQRLPLIFSGLESAFDTGRPYEAELAALRQAVPETAVPAALLARAASGLPRPDDVQRRLTALVPDILAGRPGDANAEWPDATMDWFRGIVAMRPTDAVEGDAPEAVVARLENAIARGDFTNAGNELAALPASMRGIAGPVGDDIALLAEAEAFLAALRAQALAGGNGA